MWEPWIKERRCSDTPIVFYIKWKHGSSSADVIGLDWTVNMADGKRRLGSSVRDLRVHGNVDPSNLLSLIPALTEEIYRWIVYFVELKSREDCWTNLHGIYSNLGHGVLVGTSEEALAHFFETARSLAYETLFLFHVLPRDFSSMRRGELYGSVLQCWVKLGTCGNSCKAMEKKGVKKIAVNSIIELNGNTTDSQLMTKRIFDLEEIYSALYLDGSQC
ncbi:hypothetical protein F2Q68_00023081 [Brassica cretica]|uniref:Uroporphyrinogen decarboxylase (URO-D) domain-containing protein n=1 Tax=Brassica cretica TaxID=69181 RepID=A0A8S9FVM2_BRACR|nr:hypothetical protein F2Q68_00023081 [Brassica cretica]